MVPNRLLSAFSFERVLSYYDGPRLILLRSLAGQLYLAWWNNTDDNIDRWIYLPLSERRLHELLTGEITCLEGLKSPEDGYLFVVDEDLRDDSNDRMIMVSPEALPEVVLPYPDSRLDYRVPEEVSGLPSRERAHLLDIRFKSVSSDPTGRVGARAFGQLVGNFQQLLDAVGQAKSGEPSTRGSIPSSILEQTRLDPVSAYTGSFGLRLETHSQDNLFGESLVRSSLEALFDLVAVGHDVSGLTSHLTQLKTRVANSYGSFLLTIDSSLSVAMLNWSQPGRMEPRQVQITGETARSTIAQMKVATSEIEDDLEVTATFVMGNMRTLRFEVQTSDTDERISGTIDEGAVSDLEATPLGTLCRVTLQPQFQVVDTTGEQTTAYTLLRIMPS